eukprot:c18973_g1_i2 orf=137-511(+)
MGPQNEAFRDVFMQYALITSAVVAVMTGYYMWSFKKMVIAYGVGVFLTMLVVVPDWAYFKRPPSEWIEPMASDPQSRMLQKARFPLLKKTPKYIQREDVRPLRMMYFVMGVFGFLYIIWKFVTS